MSPEEKSRLVIDKKLQVSGWKVQDLKNLNLSVALGVAVREFPTNTGPVDYALFVGGEPVGVVEAKKSEVIKCATGENPTLVACRDADVIIGPIGIISADSMLGEITPAMAVAVGQSKAVKLLLPVNRCNNRVVGVPNLTLSELVKETVKHLKELC